MSLTKKQVLHIASLSQLHLDDEEMEPVLEKLSKIINLVDELQSVETIDILPMAHPMDMVQKLRSDKVTETNQRDFFQENAPLVQKGHYLVPKVIE